MPKDLAMAAQAVALTSVLALMLVSASLSGCAPSSPPVTAPEAGAPAENSATPVQGADAGAEPVVADPLPTGPWQLVAIQRPGAAEEPIGADPAYTIEFHADGRFSGRAHCNRYTGGYQQPEPGRLTIAAAMAATLAACPPPSIADEFLRAVGAVSQYETRGEQLRLSYGTGGVLIFGRSSPSTAAAAPEVGRTFVFDCADDLSFTVRAGPGEVALWAARSLGGVPRARYREDARAHYQDGDSVYWNKGEPDVRVCRTIVYRLPIERQRLGPMRHAAA
jgi:heat shock protein HslJ